MLTSKDKQVIYQLSQTVPAVFSDTECMYLRSMYRWLFGDFSYIPKIADNDRALGKILKPCCEDIMNQGILPMPSDANSAHAWKMYQTNSIQLLEYFMKDLFRYTLARIICISHEILEDCPTASARRYADKAVTSSRQAFKDARGFTVTFIQSSISDKYFSDVFREIYPISDEAFSQMVLEFRDQFDQACKCYTSECVTKGIEPAAFNSKSINDLREIRNSFVDVTSKFSKDQMLLGKFNPDEQLSLVRDLIVEGGPFGVIVVEYISKLGVKLDQNLYDASKSVVDSLDLHFPLLNPKRMIDRPKDYTQNQMDALFPARDSELPTAFGVLSDIRRTSDLRSADDHTCMFDAWN